MKTLTQIQQEQAEVKLSIATNRDAKDYVLTLLATSNLSDSVKRTRASCMRRFFKAAGDAPIWTMPVKVLQGYLLHHAKVCANVELRLDTEWDCSLRLVTCPGLIADQFGGESKWSKQFCPQYELRTKKGVQQHINSLVYTYEKLVDAAVIPYNIARGLGKWWEQQAVDLPPGDVRLRSYLDEELATIFRSVKDPQLRIVLVTLYKTAMRIEEFLHLDWTKLHIDQGWGEIPMFKGKRSKVKGERRFVIDDQFARELRHYRVWWESKAQEGVTSLYITQYGKAPGKNAYDNLYDKYQAVLVALGINDPDSDEEWCGFHTFRHNTTTIWRRGDNSDYGWVEVLRGCKPPGNPAYLHPTPVDLQREYYKSPPRIPI